MRHIGRKFHFARGCSHCMHILRTHWSCCYTTLTPCRRSRAWPTCMTETGSATADALRAVSTLMHLLLDRTTQLLRTPCLCCCATFSSCCHISSRRRQRQIHARLCGKDDHISALVGDANHEATVGRCSACGVHFDAPTPGPNPPERNGTSARKSE